MAKLVIAGPLGEADLGHEPRMHPVDPLSAGDHARRRKRADSRARLTPVGDGARSASRRRSRFPLARVAQLAALVESDQQGSEADPFAPGIGASPDDELLAVQARRV